MAQALTITEDGTLTAEHLRCAHCQMFCSVTTVPARRRALYPGETICYGCRWDLKRIGCERDGTPVPAFEAFAERYVAAKAEKLAATETEQTALDLLAEAETLIERAGEATGREDVRVHATRLAEQIDALRQALYEVTWR